jgi:hypothetical protein
MGNLLVLDGEDAKFITRSADGSLKLTEYHYEKDSDTITINAQRFNVLGKGVEYKETSLDGWQTRKDVIELPPVIAKRFGIDRVISIE